MTEQNVRTSNLNKFELLKVCNNMSFNKMSIFKNIYAEYLDM